MKKFGLLVIALVVAGSYMAAPALAIPPFGKGFGEKYNNADIAAAAKAAGCNVCHDKNSKSKKDKNEYGKAVGKFLSKAEFEKVKADAEAAKKFIDEGLTKAEAEKSSGGKTFGEILKGNKLPAE